MAQDVYFYSAAVNIRQTTNSAANTTIWSMRNDVSSGKTIFIERIEIIMAFDTATPLTRSLQRYNFVRFSGATPTSGTTITSVELDSSAPSTAATDIRFIDTGLSTSGVTFSSAILTTGVPATDSAVVPYQSSDLAIKLNPGEGFCIRLNNIAVTGQSITGFITWSER